MSLLEEEQPRREGSLVRIYDFDDTGRGCRCVRDVKAGEELLAIPYAQCWSASESGKIPELAAVAEAGEELSDLNVCALHLLMERAKGPKGARWQHIQEMPAVYDSPAFWSKTELEALQGSAWLGLAKRFGEEIATDWETLQEQLRRGGAASLLEQHSIGADEYRWAYATIKSRAAECTIANRKVRLMAPDFDMFNHDHLLEPGSSHRFDEERRLLVVTATRDHSQGEQAFISYGPAGNGSLLLMGGFCISPNRFDGVEVPLTVRCDARRLPLYLMQAPDAPPPSELPTFEFLTPVDEVSVELALEGSAELATKHLLTLEAPLPPSLLGYIRLERLSDAELDSLEEKAKAKGQQAWQALLDPKQQQPMHEVLALAALRAVLAQMREAYIRPGGGGSAERAAAAEDAVEVDNAREAEGTGARRGALAAVLVASEKRILDKAIRQLEARLAHQLKLLLGTALNAAKASRSAGADWAQQLQRRHGVLEDQRERFELAFERLQAAPLAGRPSLDAALHAQSCCFLFMLLASESLLPFAHHACYLPAALPLAAAKAAHAAAEAAVEAAVEAAPGLGALPPLSSSLFESPTPSGSEGGGLQPEGCPSEKAPASEGADALPYLTLYATKMRMWSTYMLSQWGVARALSISESNTMQAEAITLRNSHAWSVPTEAALSAVAQLSPLIEMGAGNGLWAQALRKRGADVLAFDTRRFSEAYGGLAAAADGAVIGAGSDELGSAHEVGSGDVLMGQRVGAVQEGAPLEVGKHPGRTLLLMWPDYQGRGSYGLECLAGYAGEVLVLAGEWRGRTYGGCLGLCESGQSFSPEFQRIVEADFECVQEMRLPNWPLFLDTLTIWRRRAAAHV